MSQVHASVVDSVERRVGSMLKDKWRIEAVIGVGGMAAVYAATHRNGNRVAIKVLHPQMSIDANLRARFLREGYVANTVQHPGVVRVLDDDTAEDGSAFLVMELLEGESVATRAERLGGKLAIDEVIPIADQLLDTLAAAHERGVVHRDIKPENIFLTREGAVKILDFGIARVREATNTAQTSTRTGTLLGTPCFMAPEQALGRMSQVDAQSDVWAAGASLFTLISGELVHIGETPNEQLIAAATVPARSITTVAPFVPPALAAVIDKALLADKAQRWPSARAMHCALREALGMPPPPPAATVSLGSSGHFVAALPPSSSLLRSHAAIGRMATAADPNEVSGDRSVSSLSGGQALAAGLRRALGEASTEYNLGVSGASTVHGVVVQKPAPGRARVAVIVGALAVVSTGGLLAGALAGGTKSSGAAAAAAEAARGEAKPAPAPDAKGAPAETAAAPKPSSVPVPSARPAPLASAAPKGAVAPKAPAPAPRPAPVAAPKHTKSWLDRRK